MLRFGAMMMAAGVASAVLAGSAAATVTIAGLVNSGQVSGGGVVSTGTVQDANWFLDGAARPWNSNSNNRAWLANNAVSRWLTPASNGNQSFDPTSDRLYVYSLSFDLAGFDPATARFTGRFASDNQVTRILLNGTAISQPGLGTFNRWTEFSANSGFGPGVNTLAFSLLNQRQATGNPTGLRVEFLTSSIDAAVSPNAVPEPASWAMLVAGFGLIGAMRRRRTDRVAA